jgi:IS5 family transposase
VEWVNRRLSETRWKLTGCAIERAHFDKGYPGHGAADPRRVFISGQNRGVFGLIKREPGRRSAFEPVIGHKIDGHVGRFHFEGREGDAAKGHTHRRRPQSSARFRLRALLRPILIALWQVFAAIPASARRPLDGCKRVGSPL